MSSASKLGVERRLVVDHFERGAQLVGRHVAVFTAFDDHADHSPTPKRHPHAMAGHLPQRIFRRAIVEQLAQRSVDRNPQIWGPVYAQNLWTSLCIVWGEATQVLNPRSGLAIDQFFGASARRGGQPHAPIRVGRQAVFAVFRGSWNACGSLILSARRPLPRPGRCSTSGRASPEPPWRNRLWIRCARWIAFLSASRSVLSASPGLPCATTTMRWISYRTRCCSWRVAMPSGPAMNGGRCSTGFCKTGFATVSAAARCAPS